MLFNGFFQDLMLCHGWRTGAIVPELEVETRVVNTEKYAQSLTWLQALTGLLERLQVSVKPMRALEGGSSFYISCESSFSCLAYRRIAWYNHTQTHILPTPASILRLFASIATAVCNSLSRSSTTTIVVTAFQDRCFISTSLQRAVPDYNPSENWSGQSQADGRSPRLKTNWSGRPHPACSYWPVQRMFHLNTCFMHFQQFH